MRSSLIKLLMQTICVKTYKAATRKLSFQPNGTGKCTFPTTKKCTNGATSLRITFAKSKSSEALTHDTIKLTKAIEQHGMLPQSSLLYANCPQTLEGQREIREKAI